MNQDLQIIRGSTPDPALQSLSMEVWLHKGEILRLGRYKERGWQVTIMDIVEINWEDFLSIIEEFEKFIPAEDEAIRREQEDGGGGC